MQEKLRALLERVKAPPFDTAVCAHRGASATAPENTLSAFRWAVEAGSSMVELDVLLTRDRELAVIHDEKLGRTVDGNGRVHELMLEEIQALDAGTWFTESFAGERVPTIGQALEAIRGRAAPMIELKQTLARHADLVDRLAEALADGGADDRAVVIAWDLDTASAVRERLPACLVAVIAFTRRGVRRAAGADVDGVVTYYRSTTRRMIDEAHDARLFIAPWTVNTVRDMDFFCRAGADGIITDLPHVLVDRLERLELERARALILSADD